MSQVMLEIPDRSLEVLQVPAEHASAEMRMLLAVKLYELGRLSTGAAAEFAGVPKPVFLQRLGDYGVVTFDLTEEELDEEFRLA